MENYTLERVILGLQKEYLENYQKINKLKEYCKVKDKRIRDYYFMPSGTLLSLKEPILYCLYDKDYSKWVLLLDKIKSMLNIFMVRMDMIRIEYVKGAYRINDSKFPIQVIREDLLDFSDYVKFILNSDFVKYMDSGRIELKGKDKINILNINPGYISIIQDYHSPMYYYPYSNVLCFQKHNGIVDNQYIEDYLNLGVPISSLNPYEIEIINKSNAENQKIIIPEEIKEEEKVSFNITNAEKGLILTKKR